MVEQERRAHPRYDTEVPVRFVTADEFLVEYSTNISQGGIYVRSENPLPEGTQIQLALELPERRAMVPLAGTVVSSVPPEVAHTRNSVPGMGVRFESVNPVASQFLSAFVETLEATRRGMILVVDDEPEIQILVATLLRAENFSVIAVDNARSALEATGYGGFDVVFTDVSMPGMDGLELHKALKDNPRTADTPVIVFTSLGAEFETIAAEHGARFFLNKPFNRAHIQEILEKALESRPARRWGEDARSGSRGDVPEVFLGDNVVLAVTLEDLVSHSFSAPEAFTLSRLRTAKRVSDLASECPLQPGALIAFLGRCLVDGIVKKEG